MPGYSDHTLLAYVRDFVFDNSPHVVDVHI